MFVFLTKKVSTTLSAVVDIGWRESGWRKSNV